MKRFYAHSFIIVAFFLSCFFFVSISNEIKMEKNHRWFLPLKHSQIKKKRFVCEKSAKPNNKEKIDENPKPRSEKKEAHEETKTLKSRVWSQGETFLNNKHNNTKSFCTTLILIILSLSLSLSPSLSFALSSSKCFRTSIENAIIIRITKSYSQKHE